MEREGRERDGNGDWRSRCGVIEELEGWRSGKGLVFVWWMKLRIILARLVAELMTSERVLSS